MISPMQVTQMIKNGQNPQQLLMGMVQEQMGNTPMGANLLKLMQNGDEAALEQIARNICTQRGLNFDTEFARFRQTLGV